MTDIKNESLHNCFVIQLDHFKMNERKNFLFSFIFFLYVTMSNNSNEWINWIEEAISKQLIKNYEYKKFHSFKEIGSGNFGKVYRVNWKNSHKPLALKSFYSYDYVTVKEIVHEVITK